MAMITILKLISSYGTYVYNENLILNQEVKKNLIQILGKQLLLIKKIVFSKEQKVIFFN